MEQLTRIGVDTSKSHFQLHGVDADGRAALRLKLTRGRMTRFFQELAPTRVGMEACGASHHWARPLAGFGHEVRLMPPQYVKPYVKRGKNDAADAEAICEAMSRPSMRFVRVKTVEQQADLMLQTTRALLVKQRTQLSNAVRGHAAEFGVTTAKGRGRAAVLARTMAEDQSLPENARASFALLGEGLAEMARRIAAIEARLAAWHRDNPLSQRLAEIPSVGPRTATALIMKAPEPTAFKSARCFPAWIGLTAKDHSTAGRRRLGAITRAGDEELRALLVTGAMAVIGHAKRHPERASPWLKALIARKPMKLAAVALANKTARIAWKMMITGEPYRANDKTPAADAA